MAALVLGVAATRGTGPAGVWDAVVVFRAQAAGIIAQSDNPATGKRLAGVLVALLFSGAPLLAGALARDVGPGPRGAAVRPVCGTPRGRCWPGRCSWCWSAAATGCTT